MLFLAGERHVTKIHGKSKTLPYSSVLTLDLVFLAQMVLQKFLRTPQKTRRLYQLSLNIRHCNMYVPQPSCQIIGQLIIYKKVGNWQQQERQYKLFYKKNPTTKCSALFLNVSVSYQNRFKNIMANFSKINTVIITNMSEGVSQVGHVINFSQGFLASFIHFH